MTRRIGYVDAGRVADIILSATDGKSSAYSSIARAAELSIQYSTTLARLIHQLQRYGATQVAPC
jgi:hypothetical protein